MSARSAVDPEIVASLYDVAIDSARWPSVLDSLYPLVNAKGAAMLVLECAPNEFGVKHQFSKVCSHYDADIMDTYQRDLAHYEGAHVNATFNSVPGQIVVDPAFQDRETIVQRPDVKYALEHFGVLDRFGVRLNDDKAWVDCIAFQYAADRSNVTAQEFARFQPYLPHLAQSITLGRMYDSIRRRYQAVLGVLNKISLGLLIVRSNGAVIVSNTCAQRLIDESPLLSISPRGTLVVREPDAQQSFLSAIQSIAATAGGSDDTAKQVIVVGKASPEHTLMIECSPFSDSESEIQSGFRGVFVMIVDPGRAYTMRTDVLSDLYDLTQAESEVASLLSAGHSYEQVAEQRNVGPATIKTQVSAIYQKMRTDSRAGFFRRLIAISLPFDEE